MIYYYNDIPFLDIPSDWSCDADEFWADFWSKAGENFTVAREWAARALLEMMEGARVFLVDTSNVLFRDAQSIAVALATCVGVIVVGIIAGKIAFRLMDWRTNKKYPPEEVENNSDLLLFEQYPPRN